MVFNGEHSLEVQGRNILGFGNLRSELSAQELITYIINIRIIDFAHSSRIRGPERTNQKIFVQLRISDPLRSLVLERR